jgi:hypothetical protein
MTSRNILKLKILVDVRKNPPKDREAFKQSALGMFDCLTPAESDLINELDRLETVPGGITKLISECWTQFKKEELENAAYERWCAKTGGTHVE